MGDAAALGLAGRSPYKMLKPKTKALLTKQVGEESVVVSIGERLRAFENRCGTDTACGTDAEDGGLILVQKIKLYLALLFKSISVFERIFFITANVKHGNERFLTRNYIDLLNK